ncbi:MAG: DUF4124 domain-containing protein [Gammaproteobacteria bacterium]|nr:DUF4124 domain-containing protein [Gammaproteobacteria bacterium]
MGCRFNRRCNTYVYSWTDKNGRVHYSDVEPKP